MLTRRIPHPSQARVGAGSYSGFIPHFGFSPLSFALDAESKELLSIGVTDGRTGDSEVFEELVEDLALDDCLADGAYDSKEVFEILEEKGVDPPPGIKLRKDANVGLSTRGEKPPRSSKSSDMRSGNDYGKRWSVEGFFAALKRCFGETVRAASPEGMVQEVKRKFALYDLATRIRSSGENDRTGKRQARRKCFQAKLFNRARWSG